MIKNFEKSREEWYWTS